MALTGLGSELGEDNAFQGALMAAREDVDVTYIGTLQDESLHHVPALPARKRPGRPWKSC